LAEKIPNSGTAGIGFTPGKAALSLMYSNTVAHELGHNLSLKHIDCGAPRFDTAYPHPEAITGSWGYDMFEKVLLPPTHKDFMSYCGPVWISEYHYNKVMDYRAPKVAAQQKTQLASVAEPVFMVSGHISDSGTQQEAASTTLIFPGSKKIQLATNGQYRADVVDSQDQVLFSTTFNGQSVDHSEEVNFTFHVPRQVLANSLQTLRISHDDVLLLETSIGESQTASVQKATSPVQALRVAGDTVKVSWLVGESEQLLIRDSETQNILALDDTGLITVYSDSATLEVIRIKSSGQTTQSVITVSE
jgi:hypothetical protein